LNVQNLSVNMRQI